MPSAALRHLETLLQARKLASTLATQETAVRAVVPSGLADLDRQLQGGWPAGALSEIIGARSTGRTRVLVSTLANAAAQGHVVALVDAFDRFDPRSAAEAGLDLDRLLWVRGASLTVELARPMMLDRAVTHAVRAFDLILRAGGFGVIALDLSDAPARIVRSLPSATWLRLAHVNEGSPTVGLIVVDVPVGRSARGVSVHLDARPIWTGSSPQSRRFAGFTTAYGISSAILSSGDRVFSPGIPLAR
jgi:hypothetical protein